MSDLTSIIGDPVSLPKDEPAAAAPAPEPSPAPAPADTSGAPSPGPAPAADGGGQPAAEAPAAPAAEKTVPIQALHEARERARLAEQRAAEIERRVEQRLAALQQQLTPSPPAPPAFDQDPAGHLKYQLDNITTAQQQREQAEQQQREQAAQQAQVRELAARVEFMQGEFAESTPDYGDAVKHLTTHRANQLQQEGMDRFSAHQKAAGELAEFAIVTAAKGQNPASMAYQMAKHLGYAPKAAASAAPGAAAAPAATQAAEKFALQQRGQQAAGSLGSGGGPAAPMSAQALLSMSDEDFAEATKGNKWAKLMGG